MKSAVVFGVIGTGFVLLVLSSIWQSLYPGTASWTSEKDARWREVQDRYHVLQFTVGTAEARPSMHGGPDLPKLKQELDALKEENEQLTAEFQGVRQRPQTVSTILKWTGISLAVVGVIGWYAVKQTG